MSIIIATTLPAIIGDHDFWANSPVAGGDTWSREKLTIRSKDAKNYICTLQSQTTHAQVQQNRRIKIKRECVSIM